ncbi:hypothetical protein PG996_008429 [Apiospora saccharicola]|uniref:Uncharacterized protein n=1 Tax=Apiospora saccharicola TaxID=335842 RepID=A0ABR1UXV7_9PEZI
MQPISLQGIATVILAASAVSPAVALPKEYPGKYPGKFPPKVITPGSYHHHVPETGPRPKPSGYPNASEVNATHADYARSYHYNRPRPKPSGQPIASDVNATHADYTALTYHEGYRYIRAPADCLGRGTQLGTVEFQHENHEKGLGWPGAMDKLAAQQADTLARNCAAACSEQRRNATAAAAADDEPDPRQCRFFHMELHTAMESPFVIQSCQLFSESLGTTYDRSFLTYPEVAFARWSWSASYAPEPFSAACSPKNPQEPKEPSVMNATRADAGAAAGQQR